MEAELRARLEEQVEEGKRRAAERFAALDPETQERVLAKIASVPDLMSRAFCGPDNGKGRQEGRIFSREEVDAWMAAQ